MEAKYIKKLWKLKDYEKVKGDLFIRVLNIKRNRAILDGGIYVIQDDFALVVCHWMKQRMSGSALQFRQAFWMNGEKQKRKY